MLEDILGEHLQSKHYHVIFMAHHFACHYIYNSRTPVLQLVLQEGLEIGTAELWGWVMFYFSTKAAGIQLWKILNVPSDGRFACLCNSPVSRAVVQYLRPSRS